MPGKDMAVEPGDMAVGGSMDLAVPGDLGPADLAIPNDAIKPVLYSAFANDYATAYCAHLAQCGMVASDAQSQAACREVNAVHFGRDFDSAIMRGHLIVNELQCLDAISHSRCDGSDTGLVQQTCVSFLFVGQQQAGQECLGSEECANGYCLHAMNGAGTGYQSPGCPGTCQPFKTTTCDAPDSCNSALGYCGGGNCVILPDEGAGCLFGVACRRGLYCTTFGTPTCKKPMMQMALGGACDPNQALGTNIPPCGPGPNGQTMYCKFDASPATSATCQPKIASGGACDTSLFRSQTDNACTDGFHCDTTASGNTTGLCHPYGGLNDTCKPPSNANAPENSPADCKVNFYCDGATKKCLPLSADGEACTISSTCLAYARNDYSNPPYTCLVDNPDAGSIKTCERYQNFGTSCLPGFQDDLCYPAGGFVGGAGGANTSYCAENKNGGGSCAPKCQ